MPTSLHFKFDANQEHQLTAIECVVHLFDGLPNRPPAFRLGGEIVPNLPPEEALSESWLHDNLIAMQGKNKITNAAGTIEFDEGLVLEGAGDESWRCPHFTIEMETGTGKTYVYLRTIYELRQRYGFSKFIIVVPSIAIYEGVLKSFEITKDHFRALYNNELVVPVPYDGSKLTSEKTHLVELVEWIRRQ